MSAAAVEMIAKLVGFATVSRDSNLELIETVNRYLAGYGVESRLVPNADGSKANLFATIGPMVAGGVVVGEPTDMRIVTAHKSITGLKTVVTGHEAHSSQTNRGVSAVMTAARLITFIEDMARENASRPASQTSFEPPYSTLHVGTVGGGTASNIISRECRFNWDMRCIPEDDPQNFLDRFERYCRDDILPGMQAIAPEVNIVTTLTCSVPALTPERDGEAEALARLLTGYNASDAVAYAAEAGQFQQAGFSTVLCGPGCIDQAHQPNEYIERSQVHACVDFMRRLIDMQASA